MTIILPGLAVAFAAFCVWLTVRIVNRRERWAKRAAVALVGLVVVLIAYPLSAGPALWSIVSLGEPKWAIDAFGFVYGPCDLIAFHAPGWTQDAVEAYIDWWVPVR